MHEKIHMSMAVWAGEPGGAIQEEFGDCQRVQGLFLMEENVLKLTMAMAAHT